MSEENTDIIDLAIELVDLDEEKSELEDDLKELKEDRAEIEEELKELMSEKGVDSLRVNGRTIYFHSQYWAGYKESREQAVKALKKAGLDSYVNETYNTHSLSAYFRERIQEIEEEEGEPVMDPEEILAPELKDSIKITERINLRTRKS